MLKKFQGLRMLPSFFLARGARPVLIVAAMWDWDAKCSVRLDLWRKNAAGLGYGFTEGDSSSEDESSSEEELEGIQNYLAGTFVLQNSSAGGIASFLSFLSFLSYLVPLDINCFRLVMCAVC